MVHAHEVLHETVDNLVDISIGESGVVQLPVGDPFAHDAAHPFGDLLLGVLRQGPHCGLHGVCEHHQGCFLTPGPGPGIAEIPVPHRAAVRFRVHQGAVVEMLHEGRAVMLGRNVHHLLAQPVLADHLDALLDVFPEDPGAGRRGQMIVRIVAHSLVFREVERRIGRPAMEPALGRRHELAEIVVIGPHFGEQGVAVDALCCVFDEGGNPQGVLVGPGGPARQLLECGMVAACQLDEPAVGGVVPDVLEHRRQGDEQDVGEGSRRDGGKAKLECVVDGYLTAFKEEHHQPEEHSRTGCGRTGQEKPAPTSYMPGHPDTYQAHTQHIECIVGGKIAGQQLRPAEHRHQRRHQQQVEHAEEGYSGAQQGVEDHDGQRHGAGHQHGPLAQLRVGEGQHAGQHDEEPHQPQMQHEEDSHGQVVLALELRVAEDAPGEADQGQGSHHGHQDEPHEKQHCGHRQAEELAHLRTINGAGGEFGNTVPLPLLDRFPHGHDGLALSELDR